MPGTTTFSTFGSAPEGEGYYRHITGIPVTDATGQLIDQPFLGGFNIPRPQLIDIDGDGDVNVTDLLAVISDWDCVSTP